MRFFFALALAAVIAGCGLLGGAADLTAIEVAGRYEFTDYTVEPTAGSVDSRNLEDELDDATLLLTESGEARVERLRGGRPDRTLATGVYSISGREVTVTFRDRGDLDELLMPRSVTFDADGSRLRTEVFLEGVNLEELSDDYRGITRADVNLKISLREIGA
ncbi:MAG: hypothetical protein AAFQ43_11210 [Bacteroidota bacterium]